MRYLMTVYLDVSGKPGRWGSCNVSMTKGKPVLSDQPALVESIERLLAAGTKEAGRFKITIEANELREQEEK